MTPRCDSHATNDGIPRYPVVVHALGQPRSGPSTSGGIDVRRWCAQSAHRYPPSQNSRCALSLDRTKTYVCRMNNR